MANRAAFSRFGDAARGWFPTNWLIGGLVALTTGISGAQAGTNDPVEGGAFIWNRRSGHPTLGFVAGCAYLIEGLVGLGILASVPSNASDALEDPVTGVKPAEADFDDLALLEPPRAAGDAAEVG